MLHRFGRLKKEVHLFWLLILFLSLACRQDRTEISESESAYLADYESPSAKWGFMNSLGEMVIEAHFDEAGSFSEGLAAVNVNGRWGYIDKTGRMVIDPAYRSAWAFHEGFARVLPFDGPDHFITIDGQILSSPEWSAADDFSEGRAKVKVGSLFGFIDTGGTIVIQPIYTRCWNFEGGMAIIEFHEKLGVIGRTGEDILKPEFEKIKKSSAGGQLLCLQDNNAFVFDSLGTEILKEENKKFVNSDGDVLSVKEGNKMYLISLNNRSVVSGKFSNIVYLENERWAAKTDSGYILLKNNGTRLNDQHYTQVNKFSNGVAAFSQGDYWGYVDTNGIALTGEVFGLAWDYVDGYARAAFEEGIAFINHDQKLAFYPPLGALDMRDFSEGLAAIQIE